MSPAPSPLLPAGAVATLDRITDRLMTDTCLVKRKSTARDVGGSRVTAYGVVAAVPCQVRSVNRAAVEAVVGGRYEPASDYEIVLPRGTDVHAEDRITRGDTTFEVVSAPDEASHALTLRVAVKATR